MKINVLVKLKKKDSITSWELMQIINVFRKE